MKRMKRFLCIVLAFCMAFGMMPMMAPTQKVYAEDGIYLTFDPTGGYYSLSGAKVSQPISVETKDGVMGSIAPRPIKANKTFLGWSENPDGSGTIYPCRSSVFYSGKHWKSETYYAVWGPCVNSLYIYAPKPVAGAVPTFFSERNQKEAEKHNCTLVYEMWYASDKSEYYCRYADGTVDNARTGKAMIKTFDPSKNYYFEAKFKTEVGYKTERTGLFHNQIVIESANGEAGGFGTKSSVFMQDEEHLGEEFTISTTEPQYFVYDVTVDPNGGYYSFSDEWTNTPVDVSKNGNRWLGGQKLGDRFFFPDLNNIKRDGYEAVGYNTKPDGTGTTITKDWVMKSDLTLYVQWKKLDYEIINEAKLPGFFLPKAGYKVNKSEFINKLLEAQIPADAQYEIESVRIDCFGEYTREKALELMEAKEDELAEMYGEDYEYNAEAMGIFMDYMLNELKIAYFSTDTEMLSQIEAMNALISEFKEGQNYHITVNLKSKEGYRFAKIVRTKVLLNGVNLTKSSFYDSKTIEIAFPYVCRKAGDKLVLTTEYGEQKGEFGDHSTEKTYAPDSSDLINAAAISGSLSVLAPEGYLPEKGTNGGNEYVRWYTTIDGAECEVGAEDESKLFDPFMQEIHPHYDIAVNKIELKNWPTVKPGDKPADWTDFVVCETEGVQTTLSRVTITMDHAIELLTARGLHEVDTNPMMLRVKAKVLTMSEPFVAGKDCGLQVNLEAKPGYQFDTDNLTITMDGATDWKNDKTNITRAYNECSVYTTIPCHTYSVGTNALVTSNGKQIDENEKENRLTFSENAGCLEKVYTDLEIKAGGTLLLARDLGTDACVKSTTTFTGAELGEHSLLYVAVSKYQDETFVLLDPAFTVTKAEIKDQTLNVSWTLPEDHGLHTAVKLVVLNKEGSIYAFKEYESGTTSATISGLASKGEYSVYVVGMYGGFWSGNVNGEVKVKGASAEAVAPSNLKAVPGDTKVTLTWDAVPGATKYAVYKKTTAGAVSTVDTNVTKNSYTVVNLTNGEKIGFTVKAYVDGNWSNYSTVVWTTPEAVKSTIPENLKAVAGDKQVALTWDAVPGATKYAVFKKTTAGAVSTVDSNVTKTSYTVTGLTNGEKIGFTVKALVDGIWSGYSTVEWATPAPSITPMSLIKAVPASGAVTISWNPIPGAKKYAVYTKSAAGVVSLVSSGVTATSFKVEGLTNGTKVGFTVKALVGSTWTEYSPVLWAIPEASTSTVPENLTATAGNGQVTLKWNAVSGATRYAVYMKKTDGTSVLVDSKVTSTTYTVPGLVNGTKVGFTVKALIGSSWGGYSSAVWATPVASAVAPSNLKATAGNAKVTLTWNAVSGASKYAVYMKKTDGTVTLVSSAVTGTSYDVTGLANGTEVGFIMKSCVNGTWSGWSSTVWAVPKN